MKPENYLEAYQSVSVWERTERGCVMEYSFLSSVPHRALCCCISYCVLLTEEMLIHGSELQEILFPGEETNLVVLPVSSSASSCHMPYFWLTSRLTAKGQGQLKLHQ